MVRGAAELRAKESDRIEAVAEGLHALGAVGVSFPGFFEVLGPTLIS